MGTNRLSERLAMLVDNGVICVTTLPVPAAAPAYELTGLGEQLRSPMIALGLWGLNLPMDVRIDPASARAELIALCLTGASDPTASVGLHQASDWSVLSSLAIRIGRPKLRQTNRIWLICRGNFTKCGRIAV